MAATNVNDAVFSFKLLEALRGGDQKTLHPLLSKTQRPNGPIKELVSPLHMAVRCAEYSTIELCLSYKSIDVNVVEAGRLDTPLHVASSIGRADVVQLLLEQPDIDDTKLNADRQDATAVAKSPEIAQLIQVSQAQLNMNYLQLLQAYEKSPVPPQGGPSKSEAETSLYALLDKPRIAAVDLCAISSSGTTLLHEAVRRKDTRMIETVLRNGGDVFCRDRRGKRALESTKDESIKALLRQFSNSDPTLGNQSVSGQAPTFRGYMAKWTNFAGGYKTRWFVLENGVLSYYQTQEEEGKQSRGSINLRFAKIRADANDKHRFEIIADSTRSATKMFLRGAHPVERARWVQVLQQTQQYFDLERTASRADSLASSVAGGAELSQANSVSPSANSSVTNLHATMSRSATSRGGSGLLGSGAGAGAMQPLTAVASGQSSIRSGILTNNRTPSLASRDDTRTPTSEVDDFDIANGPPGQHRINMPHESEFTLISNSLKTQVELSQQLFEGISASHPSTAPTSASSSVDAAVSSRKSKDSSRLSILGGPEGARSSLQEALKATSSLVVRYQELVGEREAYLRRRYEQEIRAKRLWEENMTTLAKQHSEMEAALQEAAQENAAKRKQLREVREQGGSATASPQTLSPTQVDGALSAIATASRTGKATTDDHYVTPKATIASRRGDDRSPIPASMSLGSPGLIRGNSGLPSETNEDADDEFFDAIESGTLPNLRVDASLETSTDEKEWPEDFNKDLAAVESLAPYRQLRTKMPIGKDDRPSVSLWSILKSNIGKDLTKITFPVSFNEPTSMLQRMAEDMEFSECLDAAVAQADPSLRVAFVAAFAMSNYSSTIGRVAKPFNPLLGETFEYARFDKRYRYISEQVSHHPPISACFAESPLWEYMGCVDAKSKFLGRTFEIRPTGVAHVNLKLPEEIAPEGKVKDMKPATAQETRRIEHYSWNKVTTSVSGFIVGQPTIDHFGDMVVTNHVTGHKCVLTFKPRGWRGKDAFEIQGQVTDAKGQVQWEIAGRWNSQLVARRVGAGSGDLNPDENVGGEGVQPEPQSESEYVLLWKNSVKGHEPFNLTPFAITLNALTKDLRPALAPTDCRVRPDLAAFERGRFEEANTLKQALEDLQRTTRKKRELGELPAHKPRWFRRTVETDTNDVLWEPATVERVREGGKTEQTAAYWDERTRVDRENKKGKKGEWTDVFHIFGEYEVETPAS